MSTTTSTAQTVEERVLEVLSATPQTVKQVAEATGLGRSTVSKQLIESEREGKAVRTEGGRNHGRRAPDTWTKATTNRLRPGELKDKVLEYVNAAKEPVGPVRISKDTGHSSGAVANCLETLARERKIRLTDPKPKRYWHKRR